MRRGFKSVLWEMYKPKQGDMFRVIAHEINYEDAALHCAHCEEPIESAYGEQQ